MCEDPRKTVERAVQDVGTAVGADLNSPEGLMDVLLQTATLGIAGVDSDGKIKKGVASRWGDETMGEITGQNAARKARMEAKDAVTAEAAARAKQLSDEQRRRARLDVDASTEAGLLTASDSSQQRSQLLGQAEAGMSRDFLGL